MPLSMDLAIGLGVAGLVVVLAVVSFFRRGAGGGTSITAQLEAAKRAHPKPDRTLAKVEASPGVPVVVRADVTRREEEHSIWIEYAVDPGTGTSIWEADLALSATVGAERHAPPPCVVGYDGEDHLGPKGLVGVTYIPTPGGTPGIDDGNLRLATLPRADAGAPIAATVTVTPKTPYTSARFAVWIGVAPPGA